LRSTPFFLAQINSNLAWYICALLST
jgi:hypothetical protein